MSRSVTLSGSRLTFSGAPFEEGQDDFIAVDLRDAACEPLVDEAVSAITATLRSVDADTIINGRDHQDVLNANGGTLTDGTFRLDLSGAGDLVSVTDGRRRREYQTRLLTIAVTHTGGTLPIKGQFLLRADRDVP
jgi:hypothetical protein